MHQIDPMNTERDAVFFIQNWDFKKKKYILGTSLGKSKTTYVAWKSNLSYLGQNSEM